MRQDLSSDCRRQSRWTCGLMQALPAVLAVGAFALPAAAGEPPKQASAPAHPVDVSAVRDKLKLLTDGKNHYIAVVPTGDGEGVFYGDGKRFYELRSPSSGRNGESWERSFIDPRLTEGGHAEGMGFVSLRNGAYKLDCGPRATPLKLVDAAAAKDQLAAATFERSPRKYSPYALARDEHGVYYYVDHGYQKEDEKKFRLFVGPKGNLKQLKMTNIVSDVEGDIFSTKTGSLRLILNRSESLWIKDTKKSKLTIVKLDFNVQVASLYNDFGIYSGERLGTPCDDL